MPDILQICSRFDIDEQVRRTWKEVAEYLDNDSIHAGISALNH